MTDPLLPLSNDSLQSDRCAERLKALSEPLRLRIIDALRAGPRSVGELAEALAVEIVTISHHLQILRNASLLQRERKGRFVVYRLHDEVFQPNLRKEGSEHIDLGCCRLEIPRAE